MNTIKKIECPQCQTDIAEERSESDSDIGGFIDTYYECLKCKMLFYTFKAEKSKEWFDFVIENEFKTIEEVINRADDIVQFYIVNDSKLRKNHQYQHEKDLLCEKLALLKEKLNKLV